MSDYSIFEFVIKDSNIYPNGVIIYIANDKDEKSIKKDGRDEQIYHYVDDNIDLNNVFIGDTLILDEEFMVIGGADAREDK
tara:strand:+ start:79 stop:321 length:243 start_codon:yes stop_codon:yes gene_type:complete